MLRYSDEIIDEVRNSNDIIDIISQYVILKRSGRNFFGLCPFHNEKSPSFSVSPEKQVFHCFGCGAGGNVIHFLSKIENLSFKETIEELAERAGIRLPILEQNGEDEKLQLKSKIYEINKLAAQFYHENLYKPTSKIAQEYIKKRKLDNKTLKSFLIGYSGNYNELYSMLKQNGYNDKEILASSLVNKTEDGRFIDRFRKRLIFPIQDMRNRFIAFGGRVLDDSKPKYINSPENIVYTKGRHLFGLNVAKKSNSNQIIIVEGYMDAISLHQRGITNVVASLGTALTEAQGRLLRKSSEKIIIGYDSDGAGQAATLRGLEILQNLGCDIRILKIEGAKDPDEYIIKYGPERFQKQVEKSISFLEFKVSLLKEQLQLENTNDKIKFLNEIAKLLARVNNHLEKEVYIEKIANEYNISKQAIYAEVDKIIYTKESGRKVLEKPTSPIKIQEKKTEDDSISRREKMVLYLLINYPEQSYPTIKKTISIDDFKITKNREILKKLYEEFEKGNSNTNNILNWFEDQETIDYISWIMTYDFELLEIEKGLEDITNSYARENLIDTRNKILVKLEENNLPIEEKKILEEKLRDVVVKLAKKK